MMAGAPFVYDEPPIHLARMRNPCIHGPIPMPDAPSDFRYKRVLLKVSGEVLMGDQSYGIDMKTVDVVAAAVARVADVVRAVTIATATQRRKSALKANWSTSWSPSTASRRS